jgi:hypothetical protein
MPHCSDETEKSNIEILDDHSIDFFILVQIQDFVVKFAI